jgi:hypothetical protein
MFRDRGEYMPYNDDPKNYPVTMWSDPFSEAIVLETPDFALRFDNLEQIRNMVYLILNKANELDYKLTKSLPGARKGRKISKTYAKTVIKDWENSLTEEESSDDS